MTSNSRALLAQAGQCLSKGKLAEAERLFRQILAAEPGNMDAVAGLGLVALNSGHPQPAAQLFAQVASARPEVADHHSNLGAALAASGRRREAMEAFRAALKRKPGHVDARYNLGLALLQERDAAGAVKELERAVKQMKARPDAEASLGLALLGIGKGQQALHHFRRSCAMAPSQPGFRVNLANALLEMGQAAEAEQEFRKVTDAAPRHLPAMVGLATALAVQGKGGEAESRLRGALELAPNDLGVLNRLGLLLDERNDKAGAAEMFARAAQLRPNDPGFHFNHGRSVAYLGRRAEAESSLRRALALRPDFPGVWINLSKLRRFQAGDADIAAMEALIGRDDLPEKEKTDLCFALGKALEDAGDYDGAFARFAEGNRRMRQRFQYDVAGDEAAFARMVDIFDAAAVNRAGNSSGAPIFILGMPRSGTTLVEQILGSHSQVAALDERTELETVINARLGADYPQGMAALEDAELVALGQAYVDLLVPLAGDKPRFTDKMPANFRHVGLIAAALPNARIIHCSRDPMDTCVSCLTISFKEGQAFSYDQDDLGRYYQAYHKLMGHWRELLGPRMLEVRYEDLVADQEGQTRRMLEFCGLDWEPGCLDFHKTERVVLTASSQQVRNPIHRGSVARWRRYESHLEALRRALGDLAS